MDYPIVTIEWLDPRSVSGWDTEFETLDPAHCTTTGYLITDGSDDGVVRICSSISDDKGFGDGIAIPKTLLIKPIHVYPFEGE